MAEQYSWDKALQEHYYVGSYSGIAGNIPNITRAAIADGKVLNNLVFLPYSGKDNYLLDSLNSTYSECSAFSGHLNDEIVMINARADVIDVVGTHEAFTTRSASMVPGVDITHRDVIKILNDVGNDIPVWVLQGDTYVASSVSPAHQQTYYRWLSAVNNTTSGWEYVGDLEPYYSNIVANDNNQLLTFTNTNSDRNYNISAGSGVGFVVNGRTMTISAHDGKIPWVKYNQGSHPEVKRSGLSVVTSEQGTRIQNDDATEKFYVAPDFSTPTDTGKVFTIDNDGAAKWKKIPTPEKDLTLQMYKDDLLNIGSNISILKKIYIPEGTTKIQGSFNCYPNTKYETISIVLLKADGGEYESRDNLNFDHLLALNDNTGPSGSRGQYSNTLNFMFKRNSFNDPFHSLAIKGTSGSDLSNYHISNIQIMFYKERADEVNSLNSVTDTDVSEND